MSGDGDMPIDSRISSIRFLVLSSSASADIGPFIVFDWTSSSIMSVCNDVAVGDCPRTMVFERIRKVGIFLRAIFVVLGS